VGPIMVEWLRAAGGALPRWCNGRHLLACTAHAVPSAACRAAPSAGRRRETSIGGWRRDACRPAALIDRTEPNQLPSCSAGHARHRDGLAARCSSVGCMRRHFNSRSIPPSTDRSTTTRAKPKLTSHQAPRVPAACDG
jgi:hypothetical protein